MEPDVRPEGLLPVPECGATRSWARRRSGHAQRNRPIGGWFVPRCPEDLWQPPASGDAELSAAIVREAKGRLYPAKDARMPRELFEAGYPRLPEFMKYRDPGISSGLSRRLMGS